MINGVSVTTGGPILTSLRITSGIIAVDRSTGRIVWHAGHELLAQQHTPIEVGGGNVLCVDTGDIRAGSTSPHGRAGEFDPQTGQVAWAYADPMPAAWRWASR